MFNNLPPSHNLGDIIKDFVRNRVFRFKCHITIIPNDNLNDNLNDNRFKIGWDVWILRRRRMRLRRRTKLGWESWIRTMITSSRGSRLTVGRPPKICSQILILFCQLHPAAKQDLRVLYFTLIFSLIQAVSELFPCQALLKAQTAPGP